MSKRILHLSIVCATVAAGLHIGHLISDSQLWLKWRYAASRAIQTLSPRPPIAKYTSVVLIGSDEYWSSPLAARAPINRRYLAQLLNAISQGDPYLVAFDFDMRSPDPKGDPVELPEFEDETRELIGQVRKSAEQHQVILPRAVWSAPKQRYKIDSDVWNLDPGLFDLANVHGGYIALPSDLRKVPLAVPLESSGPLDSFSLAIAKTREQRVTDLLKEAGGREKLPFASYIPEKKFPTHTARSVLGADIASLRKWFSGRLVIVGGSWTQLAAKRGARVDSYLTPEGVMPGVFVHANYVEALLDQRTFEPAAEWAVSSLEVAVVLTCILVLGLRLGAWMKMTIYAFALLLLVAVNYLSLHNFGRFFDFFVPLLVIVGHLLIEQVLKWRHEANEHQACSSSVGLRTLSIAMIAFWSLAAVSRCDALHKGGAPVATELATVRLDSRDDTALVASPCGSQEERGDDGGPVMQEGVDPIAPTISGGPRKDSQSIETMGGSQQPGQTPTKDDPLKTIDKILSE